MRKRTIRTLGTLDDSGKPVKAWLRIRESEICFRKKGSRKVITISLREVYDTVTGQLKMPFV